MLVRMCRTSDVAWKPYGLTQHGGSLPIGPMVLMVHVASVWVPFTSESKEAIAGYPEIEKEIKLAVQECGRALGRHVRRARREAEERKKQDELSKERRSQVGTAERAEKIRTYNFPQNRVTDHRIGLTLHKLASLLEGDLDELIDAAAADDRAKQLEEALA